MRINKGIVAALVLGLYGVGFSQSPPVSGGGEVSGRVLDEVDGSPIIGARVQASQIGSKSAKSTITEKDGSYKLRDLRSAARFQVTFSKRDYTPEMYEITVTAKQDAHLMNLRGDQAYYKKEAENIVRMASAAGADQEARLIQEWNRIAAVPISPMAKSTIARALQPVASETLRNTGNFDAYVKADPIMLLRIDALMSDPGGKEKYVGMQIDPYILKNVQDSIENGKVVVRTETRAR